MSLLTGKELIQYFEGVSTGKIPPPKPGESARLEGTAKSSPSQSGNLEVQFENHWRALEPAMKDIDKVLADEKYGNPHRDKIGPVAKKYSEAKTKVLKADVAKNYLAANRELDKLEAAARDFQQAKREQLSDDRALY